MPSFGEFAKLSPRYSVELWGRLVALSFDGELADAGHNVARLSQHENRVTPFFPGVAVKAPKERTRYFFCLPHPSPTMRGAIPPRTAFLERIAAKVGMSVTVQTVPEEVRREGYDREQQDEWLAFLEHLYQIAQTVTDRGPLFNVAWRVVATYLSESCDAPIGTYEWFGPDLQEATREELLVARKTIMRSVRKIAPVCHAVAERVGSR